MRRHPYRGVRDCRSCARSREERQFDEKRKKKRSKLRWQLKDICITSSFLSHRVNRVNLVFSNCTLHIFFMIKHNTRFSEDRTNGNSIIFSSINTMLYNSFRKFLFYIREKAYIKNKIK